MSCAGMLRALNRPDCATSTRNRVFSVPRAVTVTVTVTSNRPSWIWAASLRTWISSAGLSACRKTSGAPGTSSERSFT